MSLTSAKKLQLVSRKIRPPTLGSFWLRQGGYYIGNIIDAGRTYALVTPPKASGENSGVTWKSTATATPGTSSTTNGLANSNAMNNFNHPAANWARSLNINGRVDWYLPASDELNVIYTNRNSLPVGERLNASGLDYYTSTEDSASPQNACTQFFGTGARSSTNKNNARPARAVRRVRIG